MSTAEAMTAAAIGQRLSVRTADPGAGSLGLMRSVSDAFCPVTADRLPGLGAAQIACGVVVARHRAGRMLPDAVDVGFMCRSSRVKTYGQLPHRPQRPVRGTRLATSRLRTSTSP
ncbi:hypothetical protein Scinn_42030 [Streptomyces virginiae]|uniref:Uncharacterized protein n=1 Tax=Streptomyces virginiae TaxID=1961 RepID=A0ABQ3NPM7_STRVG|nr:hypothetical protein Scinn_42030 [Streptomyces virginiae]